MIKINGIPHPDKPRLRLERMPDGNLLVTILGTSLHVELAPENAIKLGIEILRMMGITVEIHDDDTGQQTAHQPS